MQADLLIGFNKIQKMTGENHLGLKSTLNSGTEKESISSTDSEGKSFFEFVSMLIEESSADSLEAEKTRQALQKLLNDGESPTVLSDLLPLLDSTKGSVDQTYPKGSLESLILFFQKMSLLQENSLEDGLLVDGEGTISALEKNGNNDSNIFFDKNLKALSNPTIKDVNSTLDGSNKQVKITDEGKLQINTRINDENLEPSDLELSDENKQNSNSNMKFTSTKSSDGVEEFQSDQSGKTKLFDQSELFNQDSLKNKKNGSEAIDTLHGKKANRDSSQFSHPSVTSSQINKSASMTTNEIGAGKGGLESLHGDDRSVDINGNGEQKNAADRNGISEGFNSKFGTIAEESNLNHGLDSDMKLNSEKSASITSETKTLLRPQQIDQTDIIKQIVEKASLSSNKQHSKITIKLKPEILGNIRLNISTEHNHVSIKVMADSSTVKEILENNLHHLKSGFVNHGLQIGSFDVMVGDQPESFFKENNFSGFRRDRRQMAGQKKFSLDGTEEELAADPVQLHRTQNVNTVNDRIDYYV